MKLRLKENDAFDVANYKYMLKQYDAEFQQWLYTRNNAHRLGISLRAQVLSVPSLLFWKVKIFRGFPENSFLMWLKTCPTKIIALKFLSRSTRKA